jgi:hypothetical protein
MNDIGQRIASTDQFMVVRLRSDIHAACKAD